MELRTVLPDQDQRPKLKATQTLNNLKEAFLREAQANLRYLFCARQADLERQPRIAQVLRAAADEERGHAFGFLDLLLEFEGNSPELVCKALGDNLESAIEAELHEFDALYTRFAAVAEEEGFSDIALWFLELAKAGQTHARWLQQCREQLQVQ